MVRYDKFDSITLPLPEVKNPGLSLGHLLSEYIAAENLTDVTCESCNETCNHTKSVTFAKVWIPFLSMLDDISIFIIFQFCLASRLLMHTNFAHNLVGQWKGM